MSGSGSKVSGGVISRFAGSRLMPVLVMAGLLLGLGAVLFAQSAKRGQQIAPLVDIFISYPGASARQVAASAVAPLERMMRPVAGVRHIYSTSKAGEGLVTLRFQSGAAMRPALARLRQVLAANRDKLSAGVGMPLVKLRGGERAAVMRLILWSPMLDDASLRQAALELQRQLQQLPELAESSVTGGRPELVRIEIKPAQLAKYGIAPADIAQAVKAANPVKSVGNNYQVQPGAFLQSAHDLKRIMVGMWRGRPVLLRDVALISEGPGAAMGGLTHYTGPSALHARLRETGGAPAVVLNLYKQTKADRAVLIKAVLARLAVLKRDFLPENVHVEAVHSGGTNRFSGAGQAALSIYLRMPRGVRSAATDEALQQMSNQLLTLYEVTALQTYSGSAAAPSFRQRTPQSFAALDRGRGVIELQLLSKAERSRSHRQIVAHASKLLQPLAVKLEAEVEILQAGSELQPQQSLVAEIQGGSAASRQQLTRKLSQLFDASAPLSIVGNSLSSDGQVLAFAPNASTAANLKLRRQRLDQQLDMLFNGSWIGGLRYTGVRQSRPLVLQAPRSLRSDADSIGQIALRADNGKLVQLKALGRFRQGSNKPFIHRKDLQPLEYVSGRLSGTSLTPTQARMAVRRLVQNEKLPTGIRLNTEIWGAAPQASDNLRLSFHTVSVLFVLLLLIRYGQTTVRQAHRLRANLRMMRRRVGVADMIAAVAHQVRRKLAGWRKSVQRWLILKTLRLKAWRLPRWRLPAFLSRVIDNLTPVDHGQVAVDAPVIAVTASRGVCADLWHDDQPEVPDKWDDLRAISGIGAKVEQILHHNGIFTYQQLAQLTEAEALAIELVLMKRNLAFKGVIERNLWLQQAQRLMQKRNSNDTFVHRPVHKAANFLTDSQYRPERQLKGVLQQLRKSGIHSAENNNIQYNTMQ